MMTKGSYLVFYDISDNRLRKQIADRLCAIGLERVQLSVFMGTIKIKKRQDFSWWFQQESVTFVTSKDSMVIVPLNPSQIVKRNVFGPKKIDVEMLTDTKRTLLF
jgi:CRISPR-associated protein Cas2